MWQVQTNADVVQEFIDFSLSWLEDCRYTLTVDTDMGAWARAMGNAPGSVLVNPTFDPRFSPLSPDNSFWLDIRMGSQTIGMMAGRLFLTDDYLELKRSLRLWYDPPRPGDGRLAISVSPDMPMIRGKVAHEGGLWVHPEHRKRGLSTILPHLTRALCFRLWDIDWLTGATMRRIGECGIATWGYGVRHAEACYEGFFPVTRTHERIYIVYMDRDELIRGLDPGAVTGLLANTDKKVGHAPLLVQEG